MFEKSLIMPLTLKGPVRLWLICMATIFTMYCIGSDPLPKSVYPLMLFASLPVFVNIDKSNVSNSLLILILVAIISIVFGNPDPRFLSGRRLLYFVLLLLVVSPLLRTERVSMYRFALLRYVMLGMTILSVASFFCYFLGINLMHIKAGTRYASDFSIGGTFGGMFSQSMILGPMSALSSLFILSSDMKIFEKRWIRIILLLLSIGALLLSASRVAIVAGGVALIFLIYHMIPNKTRFIRIVIVASLILVLTYPWWSFLLDGVIYKNEVRHDAEEGLFSSRMDLFNHRLNEFSSHPVTGCGFSAAGSIDYFEVHKGGTVEYGSSWLCVLATMGLMGAIPFLVFVLSRFFRINKIKGNNKFLVFLYSGMVFYFVEFLTEGFVFSAGSPLCFVFWLIMGCTYCNETEYSLKW